MATLLSQKKSTYGSPYAYYTFSIDVMSRTPTSVKVRVTVTGRLQYSSSYIYTGKGYGLVAGIYLGGSWREWTLKKETERWSGTANHSASAIIDIPANASLSKLIGIYVRVRRSTSSYTAATLNQVSVGSINIANVTATYDDVDLTAGDTNQAESEVILSGLPSAVGYERSIKWYNGTVFLGTTVIAASSKMTSFSKKLTGLLPNTDYTVKAIISGDDVNLKEKTVIVSTPQETGTLSLTAASTYLTACVSDMFNLPNYTRSVEFYIKKSDDADYVLFTTKEVQGATVSASLTGLISNVKYDVMVRIKNGNTTLKTLNSTMATTKDISLVPTARIESISQRLSTRNCTITWIVDKEVAGTTYTIQGKKDGDSDWTTLGTLSGYTSPYMVVAKAGNVDTVFRISAVNGAVAASVVNYSNEYEMYVRDDFVWDTPKTKGQPMVITANEWNRLRDYAISRNREKGNQVDIPVVRQGDTITAMTYNIMKNAINQVSAVGVIDKKRGDAITATDVDALRIAINNVA